MQDTDHYSLLLGIESPWRVTDVHLDASQLSVTIEVRLDSDTRLRCPHCGREVPRYDSRRRRWRHLDIMQFRALIEAELPRVECSEHGVVQIRVPWAEDSSRYTMLVEAYVIDRLKTVSTSAVARHLRLSWSAIDGIMQRAVARGLRRRTATTPTHLSVDEPSFQRRHEYVTIVTDQSTGAVLHVTDNRTREALASYFRLLSEEDCASIESASMDMWPAYISTVKEFVPDAERKICFDKFPVATYLGKGVDMVRRAEHKQLLRQADERLKGRRYRWLEHPATMKKKHLPTFRELRDSALKTATAWSLKEHAMCLWGYVNRTWATKAWKAWKAWADWASSSRLAPMKKVAQPLTDHLWGIVNAIVLKRSNAVAESTNSRIQRMKSRACGFRNRERFRTAIMSHFAQLDLYPRHGSPA